MFTVQLVLEKVNACDTEVAKIGNVVSLYMSVKYVSNTCHHTARSIIGNNCDEDMIGVMMVLL